MNEWESSVKLALLMAVIAVAYTAGRWVAEMAQAGAWSAALPLP